MAEIDCKEEDRFLDSEDMESSAFLRKKAHTKHSMLLSRSLAWTLNAILLVGVLALLWERNQRIFSNSFRDQAVYCKLNFKIPGWYITN